MAARYTNCECSAWRNHAKIWLQKWRGEIRTEASTMAVKMRLSNL